MWDSGVDGCGVEVEGDPRLGRGFERDYLFVFARGRVRGLSWLLRSCHEGFG